MSLITACFKTYPKTLMTVKVGLLLLILDFIKKNTFCAI